MLHAESEMLVPPSPVLLVLLSCLPSLAEAVEEVVVAASPLLALPSNLFPAATMLLPAPAKTVPMEAVAVVVADFPPTATARLVVEVTVAKVAETGSGVAATGLEVAAPAARLLLVALAL